MGANARVINLTSGCRLKRNQAKGRVEQCLSAWVEEGFTIRDLTLAETVKARSEEARERLPLPHAELPNLVYQPSPGNIATTRQSYRLAVEANQFVESLP